MAHAIGGGAGTTNVKVALVGPEGKLAASDPLTPRRRPPAGSRPLRRQVP